MRAGECLDENALVELAGGLLPADEQRQAHEHIDRCARCRVQLAVAAAGSAANGSSDATSRAGKAGESDLRVRCSPGARIGRFVVLEHLGEGSMGLVLAAFDPDLDRKVALKLLKSSSRSASGAAEERARFLREARAMAKLAHRHVLTIHDVGTSGDDAFFAMEFASGGTLRHWLEAQVRSWKAVVAVLIQAGRGLWAAHQSGLVHRDFKPDNVLLTSEGDARVADFGLALIGGSDEPAHRSSPEPVVDPKLTYTGQRLGTPRYMAPEQHEGLAAGPGADQFAFAVTLWEALYGVPPFAGRSYEELAANVLAERVTEPRVDRGVPAWLHDVARRGLRRDPATRWPSMGALIEALCQDPEAVRRQRIRRAGFVAGATALLALGGFGLWHGATAGAPRCQGQDEKLAGVWDDGRKAEVRAALLSIGDAGAADIFGRVEERLDEYARTWVSARTEACEATHVRGEQSDALLDLKMACLDRRLFELEGLAGVLAADPDRAVLDKAVEAAAKLPPIAACDDARALQAIVPLPESPAKKAAAEDLRRRIAEVAALESTGRYVDALARIGAVERDARGMNYAPVLAEALTLRGQLEAAAGDATAAQAILEEALSAAATARDDALATEIWPDFVYLLGTRLAQPETAVAMRPAAEAALARAGNPSLAEVRLWNALASAQRLLGRHDEAGRHFERALQVREKLLGPDHPDVGASLHNLGLALSDQGAYDDASDVYERAVAVLERTVGRGHPHVANTLNNLGSVLLTLGRHDEALRHHERSLAIREQRLGAEHPHVALSLHHRGNALRALGRLREAERAYRRALAIMERTLGPDHPRLALPHTGLAEVRRSLGRLDAALAAAQRGLAIRTAALEGDHPHLAASFTTLGNVLVAQARYDEARDAYQRALVLLEPAVGPDHPHIADMLTGLAMAELSRGRHDDARVAAERALRIRNGSASPKDAGETRFVLARALWATGSERTRALALARQARDELADAGVASAETLAEAETWLRARGSR